MLTNKMKTYTLISFTKGLLEFCKNKFGYRRKKIRISCCSTSFGSLFGLTYKKLVFNVSSTVFPNQNSRTQNQLT